MNGEREKLTTAKRQAVVVIHGMGEQRPMATLRSFVEAVWETDLSLTKETHGKCESGEAKETPRCKIGGEWRNRFWIVPDSRTGSAELARIATPAADNGVRTDFYEFYWADIMQGTTLQHLRAWIFGLLLRWPHHVPRDVMSAWVWLWVGTLVTLAFAAEGLFGIFSQGLAKTMTEVAGSPPEPVFWKRATGVVAGAVVAGGLAYVLADRLSREKRRTTSSEVFMALSAWLLFLGIGFLLPWQTILTVSVAMLVLSTGVGVLVHQLVVPYLGDVARYVRSEPATVEKRRDIRERGLALLRALHREAPPAVPKEGEGADAADGDHSPVPERYDRIVVVGHSLGSIIAYDLLRLFWLEAGPSRDRPGGWQVDIAFDNLVAFLETKPDLRAEAKLDEYRDLQRAVSRAMAAKRPSGPNGARLDPDDAPLVWRISDFITLGSPLTHSEFLLARNVDHLEELVEQRQIATSPPLPNDSSTCDFRYRPDDHRLHVFGARKERPLSVPHHAAMFAATRWTNIYDRHSKVLLGDIVSGPVQKAPAPADLPEREAAEGPGMGLGIRDRHVRIRWPKPLIPGLERLFTHTLYWACDAEGRLVSDGTTTPSYSSGSHPKDHLVVLRQAMALDEQPPAEPTAAPATT